MSSSNIHCRMTKPNLVSPGHIFTLPTLGRVERERVDKLGSAVQLLDDSGTVLAYYTRKLNDADPRSRFQRIAGKETPRGFYLYDKWIVREQKLLVLVLATGLAAAEHRTQLNEAMILSGRRNLREIVKGIIRGEQDGGGGDGGGGGSN